MAWSGRQEGKKRGDALLRETGPGLGWVQRGCCYVVAPRWLAAWNSGCRRGRWALGDAGSNLQPITMAQGVCRGGGGVERGGVNGRACNGYLLSPVALGFRLHQQVVQAGGD